MASLFSKPKQPKVPKFNDEAIAEERKRILAERKGGGRAGTILTGGAGVSAPILGTAAALTGGM